MGGQWDGGYSVAKPISWSCLSSGGLASEKDYPFKGYPNPHGCLANRYKKVAWIQDFTMLDSDEQGTARVDMGAMGRGQRNQNGVRQTWLWETQLKFIPL